jgi:FKBP-type peptidyl-prolyl cis-trans isomerase FkpA
MMKKKFLLIFITLWALSCKKNREETETTILSAYIETLNTKNDTLYGKTDGIYFIDTNVHIQNLIKPEAGDTVYLKYTGYFLKANSVLDTFIDVRAEQPDIYVYQKESVIPGWERGVGMMSPNRPVKLIIPSDLAYGNRNEGIIPAYSSLVFDAEILKIIKAVK